MELKILWEETPAPGMGSMTFRVAGRDLRFFLFLRFSLSAAKSLLETGLAGVCIGIANLRIIRHEAVRQRMNKSVMSKGGLTSYADSNEETLGVCGTKEHGKIAAGAIRGFRGSTAFD
jgi:hypothetical protein